DRLVRESLRDQHRDLQLTRGEQLGRRGARAIQVRRADRVATLAERYRTDDPHVAIAVRRALRNDEADLPIDRELDVTLHETFHDAGNVSARVLFGRDHAPKSRRRHWTKVPAGARECASRELGGCARRVSRTAARRACRLCNDLCPGGERSACSSDPSKSASRLRTRAT